MSAIRDHLQGFDTSIPELQDNKEYPTAYHYVLANGIDFTPVPLPKKYASHVGKIGRCFYNAWRLACDHPGKLRYAEGLATGFSAEFNFPILHAWCADELGNAIDPTWGSMPDHPKNAAYLGLAFPLNYVNDSFRRHGAADSIIENWRDGTPLLMGIHVMQGREVVIKSPSKTARAKFKVTSSSQDI
jgi:hypothetical protein